MRAPNLVEQAALAEHVNFFGALSFSLVPQLGQNSYCGMKRISLGATKKPPWFALFFSSVCSWPRVSHYTSAGSQCNLAIAIQLCCPCSDYFLISFSSLDHCLWRGIPSARMFFQVNKKLCRNGPPLMPGSVCTTYNFG